MFDASSDDIQAASEIVVDINSEDMATSYTQSFPINSTTFKNGKFSCTITDADKPPMKTSFALNTKTAKFTFTAKNTDMSGLSCPLAVQIEIGDYNAQAEVNEAIINGKSPIPIALLMSVEDSLRVDKSKFTRNKTTSNITQVSVSGGFSDAYSNDVNLLTNPLDITIGSTTFTIPASSFINSKGKFTCSSVNTQNSAGVATAAFDFNKCTFTLAIKNTNFSAASGNAELNISFGGFSGSDAVLLP